ncbi:TPA: type II toxin-antitoxin system RelE/ParE family toxin [candidate division WOR-3 bacterium]|uniref:Type II toxin-antitoxin system RelE/ParE family toxin n=1 Tax=candidate division WOR-3 bacterium TaxID=2052148 RepID=A0A350HBR3_UNCW3|nr:type II toxin-antitoxin system RelE/ParE family toxin [candidate division WOR-3 bacterium]
MKYSILYHPDIRSDIKSIPKQTIAKIISVIEEKLADNPIMWGKPLKYSLKGLLKVRFGDYRIVYKIFEEEKKVLILIIRHRKDIYKKLSSRN